MTNFLPCTRRRIYRDKAGKIIRIVCIPSLAQIQSLSPAEAIKQPTIFQPCDVDIEVCQRCTKREINATVRQHPQISDDGVVTYDKFEGDWEPPPTLPGYRHKSNDPNNPGAWILEPQSKQCVFLQHEQFAAKNCDCIRVRLVCMRGGYCTPLKHPLPCDTCEHKTFEEGT